VRTGPGGLDDGKQTAGVARPATCPQDGRADRAVRVLLS